MLTAASCQPMPGPAGAAWPSARPGIDYCGPYPACCPSAPDRWPWLHAALAGIGSDTALYAALGLLAVTLAVFAVVVRRELRRLRGGA